MFKIFLTFVRIGLMLFGGGNVVLSVAQKELGRKIKKKDACELYAIARSIPGIVAPNFAVLTGYKLAGTGGSIAALLGLILPSFLIITALAVGFGHIIHLKFIRSIFWGVGVGVVMLIFMGVQEIWEVNTKNRLNFILFFAAFVLLAGFRMPPSAIVLMAAAYGIAAQLQREEAA